MRKANDRNRDKISSSSLPSTAKESDISPSVLLGRKLAEVLRKRKLMRNKNRWTRHGEDLINEEEFLQHLGGDHAIECICPKCGTLHVMILFWTGRGMPRKFCPLCKSFSEKIWLDHTTAVPGPHRIQMDQTL